MNRPSPPPLFIIIAAFLVSTSITMGANTIAKRIEQQNSIYLCIEAWKLGIKPKACDAIKDQPHG